MELHCKGETNKYYNKLYVTCKTNIKVWFVHKDITQWRFYIDI